jgi:pyrimidine operon attenuation protein / uracil phosphoribosyltransferase
MTIPNPETLLSDISAQIKTKIDAHGAANCALVGIHSGGVWLMDRILKSLKISQMARLTPPCTATTTTSAA